MLYGAWLGEKAGARSLVFFHVKRLQPAMKGTSFVCVRRVRGVHFNVFFRHCKGGLKSCFGCVCVCVVIGCFGICGWQCNGCMTVSMLCCHVRREMDLCSEPNPPEPIWVCGLLFCQGRRWQRNPKGQHGIGCPEAARWSVDCPPARSGRGRGWARWWHIPSSLSFHKWNLFDWRQDCPAVHALDQPPRNGNVGGAMRQILGPYPAVPSTVPVGSPEGTHNPPPVPGKWRLQKSRKPPWQDLAGSHAGGIF